MMREYFFSSYNIVNTELKLVTRLLYLAHTLLNRALLLCIASNTESASLAISASLGWFWKFGNSIIILWTQKQVIYHNRLHI